MRPQRAQPSSGGPRLRLRTPDRQDTKPRGAAHATRSSCAPPTSKAWHRGSPSAPSVRETISLGMSESTRGRRMTPRLAPVAFEDLTVPRAAEGGKSARQGKAMEDKGKGKAEEGQDTYGDGGSSGRGGGRGEGKCRHVKQRGKCKECRGEGASRWPSAPSGPQKPPAPAAGSCAGHAWTRTSPG